jgi:hypothetical protein
VAAFPQRFRNTARPGSLFKGLAVVSPGTNTAAGSDHDEDYLDMIRECPCLRCGLDPCREAAHVRMSSPAHGKRNAMAKKPSDRWTVPLCEACHTREPDSQHKVGELVFWHRLGMSPLLISVELYAQRGSIPKMRAVAFKAMAEAIP